MTVNKTIFNPDAWHERAVKNIDLCASSKSRWSLRAPKQVGANLLAIGTGAAAALSQTAKFVLVQPLGMTLAGAIGLVRILTWSDFLPGVYHALPGPRDWVRTAGKIVAYLVSLPVSALSAAGSLINSNPSRLNLRFQQKFVLSKNIPAPEKKAAAPLKLTPALPVQFRPVPQPVTPKAALLQPVTVPPSPASPQPQIKQIVNPQLIPVQPAAPFARPAVAAAVQPPVAAAPQIVAAPVQPPVPVVRLAVAAPLQPPAAVIQQFVAPPPVQPPAAVAPQVVAAPVPPAAVANPQAAAVAVQPVQGLNPPAGNVQPPQAEVPLENIAAKYTPYAWGVVSLAVLGKGLFNAGSIAVSATRSLYSVFASAAPQAVGGCLKNETLKAVVNASVLHPVALNAAAVAAPYVAQAAVCVLKATVREAFIQTCPAASPFVNGTLT